MPSFGRGLMLVGVILFIMGAIWTFIGRLPGDLVFKKGSTYVFFPIMTSLILSVVLSLIFYIVGRFR
jgi:hypothetical protein